MKERSTRPGTSLKCVWYVPKGEWILLLMLKWGISRDAIQTAWTQKWKNLTGSCTMTMCPIISPSTGSNVGDEPEIQVILPATVFYRSYSLWLPSLLKTLRLVSNVILHPQKQFNGIWQRVSARPKRASRGAPGNCMADGSSACVCVCVCVCVQDGWQCFERH